MSKVDAQRALRDARYARFAAARAAEAKGGTKPPRAKPVELDPPPEAEPLLDDSLLGQTAAAVPSGTGQSGTGQSGAGQSGAGKRAGSKSPAGKQSTRQADQAAEVLPFSEVPLAEQTSAEADATAVIDLRDASSPDGVAVVVTTPVSVEADTVVETYTMVEAAPLAHATDADGEGSSAEVADAGHASEEQCGHRSMNGRTCTRDKGHPQKNHRYN